jgi:hypothetical protein
MRIATWNCARGPFAKKRAALDALAPDVVVLTEAAQPPADMPDVLWFGEGRFGVAIYAKPPFQVRRSRRRRPVPCVYPVTVTGPLSFTLFGVWTWPAPSYKAAFRNALDAYAGVRGLRVFAGDFNGNVDFDRPRARTTWAQSFARLRADGLVSAYHGDRPFGGEADPTHYFLWRQSRPFHLDYCFVPSTWPITRVSVGNYEDWARLSDHRPVVVDVQHP